jgi:predicted nucleotidyltransferase
MKSICFAPIVVPARRPCGRATLTNMVGPTTNTVGADAFVDIFATRTTARILAVFALRPDAVLYQKEIVDLTGSSLYLVQRELKRLERTGLIARSERGRHVEYRALTSHPAFPGIRDALLRTIALGDALRASLEGLPDVRLAFVFGSVARGEATSSSDIDLMVVGDLGTRQVAESVVPLMRDLGREANLVVMDPNTLRSRADAGDHFVSTVLADPKIWLVGDDHELAALTG